MESLRILSRHDASEADESECSEDQGPEEGPPPDSEGPMPNDEFDPDMFGMTACALVRDFYFLADHRGASMSRIAQLGTTILLLAICISTELFLLLSIKTYVSAKAVHDVRIAYSAFEEFMYEETEINAHGHTRGVPGTFLGQAHFGTMDLDLQTDACRIPLSQPHFFFVVLVIWTLSCFKELRTSLDTCRSLVINTEVCESMRDALVKTADTDGSDDQQDFLIHALTYPVKACIFVLVVLPRVFISICLLWLGCRWLLATNCFSDLILNAVALAFVLDLKDLLYETLVSRRNHLDLENTKVLPDVKFKQSSIWMFTKTLGWGIAACVFVAFYMGYNPWSIALQQVLPDYRWDVHEVCEDWIKWRYCVSDDCPDAYPGSE